MLAIATENTGYPPYLPETIWLNDGSGGFSLHPLTPDLGGDFSIGVMLANINGVDLDLLVANSFAGTTGWVSQAAAPSPTLTLTVPALPNAIYLPRVRRWVRQD